MKRAARQLLILVMIFGLGLALTPGTGFGSPITITNPGFETDVLGDGGWTSFYITGYTTSNSAAWNPIASTIIHYPVIPEGVNVACANGTGWISQTLTATLQNSTLYTLSVYVGKRKDLETYGFGYQVELYAGATRIALDDDSLNPAGGTFALSQITYPSLAADPLQGQSLKFILRGLGGTQVNFDAVSLDAAAVPLPGAVWLLGGGLLCLGLPQLRRLIKQS